MVEESSNFSKIICVKRCDLGMTSMNDYNNIIENETCNIILIVSLDSKYSAFRRGRREEFVCNDNKIESIFTI